MRSEPKLPPKPQNFCRVVEPKLQNFVPKPMVLVRFPQLPAAAAQKVANKVGKPRAALAPWWHCQGACKGAQAGGLKIFLLHSKKFFCCKAKNFFAAKQKNFKEFLSSCTLRNGNNATGNALYATGNALYSAFPVNYSQHINWQ